MNKKIKFLVVWWILVFLSFWLVYATLTIASNRKSQKLPWQWTPRWYYDSKHHVWNNNLEETRFVFIKWSKWDTWIVKDSVTWLIWESKNIYGKLKWGEAKKRCEWLEKWWYTGWRLPNIKELASLVDYSKYNPSINTKFFSIPADKHWSNTDYIYDSNNAWIVPFEYWQKFNRYKEWSSYFLCTYWK